MRRLRAWSRVTPPTPSTRRRTGTDAAGRVAGAQGLNTFASILSCADIRSCSRALPSTRARVNQPSCARPATSSTRTALLALNTALLVLGVPFIMVSGPQQVRVPLT